MKRQINIRILSSVFFLLCVLCFPISGEALLFSSVSPYERIFYRTSVSGTNDIEVELWSARNEYESFQIAFYANKKWKITAVEMSDLLEEKSGYKISPSSFEYRFPSYVPINKHSSRTPAEELDGVVPGFYPDPLEEQKELEFSGTRSIWGRFHVSSEVKPGDYTGQLLIYHSSGVEKIRIKLHVWDFVLPVVPSIYMTNWIYDRHIYSNYRFTKGRTENYWKVIENIADDFVVHRQSVVKIPLDLIEVWKNRSGGYEYDFQNYERWVKTFYNKGIRIFEGSHLLSRRSVYNIRYLPKITRNRIEFRNAHIKTAEGKAFLREFLSRVHSKNKELGIEATFLQHIEDESNFETLPLYRDVATIVREVMPGVAIIDATGLLERDRKGMMDIPVVIARRLEKLGNSKARHSWGKWWYMTNWARHRFPNRFIDYPLIKMRVVPWVTWRMGFSGFLHYGYNWWLSPSGKKIRKDVEQSGQYNPGDGFIVYPPRSKASKSIISSLRWEAMREGMEDVEYLFKLDQWIEKSEILVENQVKISDQCISLLRQVSSLRKEVRTEVVDEKEYPRSSSRIADLRWQMGVLLDKLSVCRES